MKNTEDIENNWQKNKEEIDIPLNFSWMRHFVERCVHMEIARLQSN